MRRLKVRLLIASLILLVLSVLFVTGQNPPGGYTSPSAGGGLPSGFSSSGNGNQIFAPNGSAAAPSYSFANANNTGMYWEPSGSGFAGLSALAFVGDGGTRAFDVNSNGIRPGTVTSVIYMNVNATTAISSNAAGVVDLGNGSNGDTTAVLKSAAVMSAGTTFTASGCANSTLVGGASAGKYTSVTAGSCTVTITMGNSATAPTGWACDAHDLTTVADANNVTMGTSTTTTANLVEGTVAANDVISFKCTGY